MNTKISIFAIFILLFFWLGNTFYMSTLDAVIFPPVTILVDRMNLKTDRVVYNPGDVVSIQISLCKNRNYTSRTTWRLLNGTVITFPDQGSRIADVGCVKDKWFIIGQIPLYSTKGVHHLEAVSEIQVNSQKKIYLNFRSQNFDVI